MSPSPSELVVRGRSPHVSVDEYRGTKGCRWMYQNPLIQVAGLKSNFDPVLISIPVIPGICLVTRNWILNDPWWLVWMDSPRIKMSKCLNSHCNGYLRDTVVNLCSHCPLYPIQKVVSVDCAFWQAGGGWSSTEVTVTSWLGDNTVCHNARCSMSPKSSVEELNQDFRLLGLELMLNTEPGCYSGRGNWQGLNFSAETRNSAVFPRFWVIP